MNPRLSSSTEARCLSRPHLTRPLPNRARARRLTRARTAFTYCHGTKGLLARFQVFKQRVGIRHRKGVFFKVVSEARLFEQFFNNAIANQH